jgi:predicted metal-dependent phosphoesterase TrpH
MSSPSDPQQTRPGESPVSPVDLHAHTTASDGTLSPRELIDLAAARGLRWLGVTDHDTVDALAEARRHGAEAGVTVVPGVELSTTERGAEVHVLGYGVDPDNGPLRDALAALAAARVRRIEQMIDRLRDAGYAIDGDAILAQAEIGSIGRPHVARALIAIGAVGSVDEAFRRFLTPGAPGWVPRERFTPEEAVTLLVEHGAVPVLAHPFSTGNIPAILDRLAPIGLLGMEVWYGEYDVTQREELCEIALRRGLVGTGGSDYHGPDFREGRELGSVPVPEEVVERLVEVGLRL